MVSISEGDLGEKWLTGDSRTLLWPNCQIKTGRFVIIYTLRSSYHSLPCCFFLFYSKASLFQAPLINRTGVLGIKRLQSNKISGI